MTVLGHYPGYLRLSGELNARHFEISQNTWNKLTRQEQWAENQYFLDRTVVRDDAIVLSTPARAAAFGSFFFMELLYLARKKRKRVVWGGVELMR